VGPYSSYDLLDIQNFKNQTGFCSYVTCFAVSSAHWTVLHMTTSTLHTLRNISFIARFCSKSLKWDHTEVMRFLVIQNFKNQTGFCSYVTCFARSSAHWTLLYMTTSTLHTLRYISVIDSFCSKSLKWDHIGVMYFKLFKISKIKLDSAHMLLVLQDQVHIGQCCT
jgi:hypothetical protein